jgi:hypothetical protein
LVSVNERKEDTGLSPLIKHDIQLKKEEAKKHEAEG